MPYTWQEIRDDWLGGANSLAMSPDKVVASFNRVAEEFGDEWIEASRTRNGSTSRGLQSTLRIISLGQMFLAVGRPAGSGALLEKIRKRKIDAWAELCGMYLLSSDKPDITVEVEPEVTVGSRRRRPDFRVRSGDEPWTYVEVTLASRNSAAQKAILGSLDRLIHLVDSCTGSYALEVFLKREPGDQELDLIESLIREQHAAMGQAEAELPSGLGTLYWNQYPPGFVTLDDHGEPYTPRLGATAAALHNGEHRHILVRWPFTDMRAEDMLTAEARQLPRDAPGIVMIQTSGAVGAMKTWRAIIERRFQPRMHTRVSAVCLFTSSVQSPDSGGHWLPECKLILNSHARSPLPDWIANQLKRFPSHEADIPARAN
jgi:hypothetical protein